MTPADPAAGNPDYWLRREAVLDRFEVSLTDVLNWKVGSRVMLNANPQSDVGLVCGDLPMFTGKMGRKHGNIAVRIFEKHDRKQQGVT